jgi:hypothetical protein
MSVKSIAKVWTFPSSTSDKKYETLLYSDGSTSCDCPGWTRRVDTQGHRSCKHTRYVDLNLADEQASEFHSYANTNDGRRLAATLKTPKSKNLCQPMLTYGHRKLCI